MRRQGSQSGRPFLDAIEELVRKHSLVLKLISSGTEAPRALVILERPVVASSEYEPMLTELAEVLPRERDRTFVD